MPQKSALELILSLILTFTVWRCISALEEVRHLTGSPDYRYVALNWEYDLNVPNLYGFQIRYCEVQAWGPHRCKTKMVESNQVNNVISRARQSRLYSVIVPGLRMSTNYSFQVEPIMTRRYDREYHPLNLAETVIVSTKGFSAKASLCLPQESEIEVSTGPYFAGRIAVESADNERCTVDGDPNSPRDIYTLRISHEVCGSKVNETTVATFVLVQENLPILTHSTRRFLVLCTYQPDTLTVRAKLNLPSGLGHDDEHKRGNRVDVDDAHAEADDENEDESDDDDFNMHDPDGNHIQVMRLQQNNINSVDMKANNIERSEPLAQFVLMMVFIVAGVAGFIVVIWWSAKRSKTKPRPDDSSSCDESLREPSEINFEIESVCGVRNDAYNEESCTNRVNHI